MSAMTWWDHKTRSIWSQPIGQALAGEMTGTELTLLPMQLTTWGNWKNSYPETLVMTNDLEHISFSRPGFSKDFVIGLNIADQAKAFYYTDVESVGIINDQIGDFPILVWAADEDYRVYLRQVVGEVLSFRLEDGTLIDNETGSTWDIGIGIATEGALESQVMQSIPSLTSFDWAWNDFYPDSEIYQP